MFDKIRILSLLKKAQPLEGEAILYSASYDENPDDFSSPDSETGVPINGMSSEKIRSILTALNKDGLIEYDGCCIIRFTHEGYHYGTHYLYRYARTVLLVIIIPLLVGILTEICIHHIYQETDESDVDLPVEEIEVNAIYYEAHHRLKRQHFYSFLES